MNIQEITQKIKSKESRIVELENMARDYEQKARDARAERSTEKLELTELRQQIHNAATQNAAMESTKAANAAKDNAELARKKAETSAAQSADIIEQLNAKMKELTDKLESLKQTEEKQIKENEE